jgi:hypothetical protein
LVVYNWIRKLLEDSDVKRANIVGVNLELDEYKRKVDNRK